MDGGEGFALATFLRCTDAQPPSLKRDGSGAQQVQLVAQATHVLLSPSQEVWINLFAYKRQPQLHDARMVPLCTVLSSAHFGHTKTFCPGDAICMSRSRWSGRRKCREPTTSRGTELDRGC